MEITRRALLQAGVATATVSGRGTGSFVVGRIKALAFDAFPLFDPRSIFAKAEELFPRQGRRAQQRVANAAIRISMAARALPPLR